MHQSEEKSASKFMSLVLRHAPAEIGITPDPEGWVRLDDLIRASDGRLSQDALRRIVETSDKQRFSLSKDGLSLRANQGHSISVDVGLTPQIPPDHLFHGTAAPALDLILAQGLRPMSRQHVHLSDDADTAHKVGMRHGKPVVLIVSAGAMQRDGHPFFCSENGVWLTHAVQPRFLKVAS